MPASPYIPAPDADFDAWLLNFSALLTAAPATYGLTAPDAVIVAAAVASWSPAYAAAINPSTRTPVTVAAKDAERASAEATVRPYAQQIHINQSVSNSDKTAIGVNPLNTSPVPIPPPLTWPNLTFRSAGPLSHNLSYQDSGLGTGKKKPTGVIAMQLFRVVGVAPAVDPNAATFYGNFTKSPLVSSFVAGDVGKQCTYFARWATRSGPGGIAQVGPWSAPLTVAVL